MSSILNNSGYIINILFLFCLLKIDVQPDYTAIICN